MATTWSRPANVISLEEHLEKVNTIHSKQQQEMKLKHEAQAKVRKLAANIDELKEEVDTLRKTSGIKHSVSRLLSRMAIEHHSNLDFDFAVDVDRVYIYQTGVWTGRKLVYVWNGTLLEMLHTMIRMDEQEAGAYDE